MSDYTFEAVLVIQQHGTHTVIDQATHSTVHGSPLPDTYWTVTDEEGNPDQVHTAILTPNPDPDDPRVFYRSISYYRLHAHP